ncbi:uncharacterized protein LOC135693555 isoform X1 [Rhopilema esculentum]|uniref:uncharacterized protein LOC135693555 isoform X1 n=1 Tax=Rhopilema esculentum TaxID=499914 RepID=UPI0031DDC7A4
MRPLHLLIFCCAVSASFAKILIQDGEKEIKLQKRGGAEIIGIATSEKDSGESGTTRKRLVAYLDFEKFNGATASDESGFDNNAQMSTGALVAKIPDSNCGNVAYLWCVDISFQSTEFQAKPKVAVTVAAWIYLVKIDGSHSIFHTVGATHPMGQYHFEVNYGNVRWFHRNESQNVVFETEAHAVKPHEWTHIAGTYNASTGFANIFINGEIKNHSVGNGYLSRDWGAEAKIGNNKMNRPLSGLIDEFRIYNYALSPEEIKQLFEKCKFGSGANNLNEKTGGGRSDGIAGIAGDGGAGGESKSDVAADEKGPSADNKVEFKPEKTKGKAKEQASESSSNNNNSNSNNNNNSESSKDSVLKKSTIHT